jgi:hypothetical protein
VRAGAEPATSVNVDDVRGQAAPWSWREYVNDLVRDVKAYSTITHRVAPIRFCQQLASGRSRHW